MEISSCKHCKKTFISKIKQYTCKDCKEKDDKLFVIVEQYLLKYPNSNALQIAEGLSIDAYEILKFIDEGRLTMVKGTFERMQ